MGTRRFTSLATTWLCASFAAVLLASTPALAKEVHIYKSSFGSPGTAPGQFNKPAGVAVNDTTHDVYVADKGNNRIQEFNADGSTLLAEFNGSAAPTGALLRPTEIAVDNSTNPLDPSKEDVYVVDSGHGVIDKFEPSGTYIGQVTGAETPGGPFEPENANPREIEGVAVDANGTLWATIYQGKGLGSILSFSHALENKYESSLETAFAGAGNGLSLDGEGNIYFHAGGGDVVKVDRAGRTLSDPFSGDGQAYRVAVDPVGGEVYLDDLGAIEAFDLNGNGIESCVSPENSCFGSGHLSFSIGVAVDTSNGTVYATSAEESADTVSVFEGVILPSVTVVPLSEQHTKSVTLNATVNPEGRPVTSCVFEYGPTGAYGQSVPCSPSNLGSGSTAVPVDAHLGGLASGTTYHYRVVAENGASVPSASADQTFFTGPILAGESVSDVTAASATLRDAVDPNGADTHYYVQYGLTTAYGSFAPVSVPGVDLGDGAESQSLSVHLQGLQAGLTYHYSFVAIQDGEAFQETDHVFTTQSVAASAALADSRSWEMVSPPNKRGAVLELLANGGQVQAANDGSGIAYVGEGPTDGENPTGKSRYFQALSRRGPTGWQTTDLTLPGRLPENGEPAETILPFFFDYHMFSPNLSLAAVEPQPLGTPPLSPEESERTLYLRDDNNGTFLPLISPKDVPEGTKIEEESFYADSYLPWQLHFLAASPDLAHIVFDTPRALTENAIDEETLKSAVEREEVGHQRPTQSNLYEWSAAGLALVNILPETDTGEAAHAPDEVAHGPIDKVPLVRLAGTDDGNEGRGNAQRSVSDDGRRIAWTWGEPYATTSTYASALYLGLYVRDMVEERTVRIGGAGAVYQTMNSDGSKIFYRENGDLYVYDWNSETATDLTAGHAPGEPNAGLQEVVSDVSEDGTYVYFVATGVLANGATGGADNLYLLRDSPSGWGTIFVATLSAQDSSSWYAEAAGRAPFLAGVSSRVSPDGRYLAFMSSRPLTGYDNTDAVSGQADEEVYLYDAQEEKLVCASCDPTGSRPVGVFDEDESNLLVDRGEEWTKKRSGTNHWLAGSIPGWDNLANDPATYQPRYLSNSGRLFFDSPDGLVPQDTNGLEDVYEYEPGGVGDCTSSAASTTDVYVRELAGRPVGGCVGLVSSGTSSSESAFYDASENGDDVFFDTTGRLVGEDFDNGYDIYDAHVCTSAVPCKTAPVASPPCTSGDSCKAAPSPQPELFGAPPSATFSGAGNVTPLTTSPGVKPRSVTSAQKLARALRACHKRKGRMRRDCQLKAHKRYASKRARKHATTGNRRKGS